MSHTPEPWILRQGNEIGVADKSDTQSYGMLNVIARVDKYDFENWPENARRIVACVNFCAGVSTEIIENSRCGEYQQALLKERDTYRDLCAELLGALKYHQAQTRPVLGSIDAITKAEKLLGEKNGTSN